MSKGDSLWRRDTSEDALRGWIRKKGSRFFASDQPSNSPERRFCLANPLLVDYFSKRIVAKHRADVSGIRI
jgi:hypothetical protein